MPWSFRTLHTPFFHLLKQWRREPLIPVLLLLVAGSVWAFLEIAERVEDKHTRTLDEALLRAMRVPGDPSDPVGPPWVEEMARDLTALGGFTLLTGLTVSCAVGALMVRKPRLAAIGVVAVLGGTMTMNLLKRGFERPRPDLVPHGVEVTNASFPSGHSMMAAVVYLTLGILLARTQQNRKMRMYLVALSVVIALLVGVSRVYLGVHWPTDVLAGWTLGAGWAVLFWLVAMKVDPME